MAHRCYALTDEQGNGVFTGDKVVCTLGLTHTITSHTALGRKPFINTTYGRVPLDRVPHLMWTYFPELRKPVKR
jgi:hypothetical protein